MSQTAPTTGRSRALAGAALALLFAFHLLRLLAFFGGPGKVVSDEPLIYHDHAWHYYFVVVGAQYLAATGTTSGYDPFIMAGHPTDLFDSSDRLLKILFSLMPFLSNPAGYKVAVLLSALVFPLVFFVAARAWGFRPLESIGATAFGLWIWWEDLGSAFFDEGMTGFLNGSSFAFLVSGAFAAFLRRPSAGRTAALAAALALGFLIHPGILPIVAVPVFFLLLLRWREINARLVGKMLIAGVVTVAVNFFWLLPVAINFRYGHGSATHFQWPVFFFAVFGATIKMGHFSYVGILAAAGLGMREWKRDGQRELLAPLAATVAVMLFIVLFGFLLPIVKSSQPTRYGMPMFFALCLPAGWWAGAQARRLLEAAGRERIRPAIALGLLMVGMALTVFRPARDPKSTPWVGETTEVRTVREWISQNTDRRARVLVEDPYINTNVFHDSYPNSYLALATGREVLGGPHWAAFLLHTHGGFSGTQIFGRKIRALSGPDLRNLLQAYNIGWVVAKTPGTVEWFDRYPEVLAPAGERDGFHFYRCPDWPNGFFMLGRGRVEADRFKLAVRDAKTVRGKVVLSYHWHPSLRVDPPRRLYRAEADEDPVGFVGVEGEGGDYDIRLRYPIFHRE